MATMAELDDLALSMPQTTKEVSDDGRPSYLVHGKMSVSIAAGGATRSIRRPASGSTTC
jgi:hypothetical protein